MVYDMKKLLALSEGILAETPDVPDVALVKESVGSPTSQAKAIVNVKDVEVSDSYVTSILNFAKSSPLNEQKTEEPKTPVTEDSLTEAQKLEERMQSLTERLLLLIKEAKEVMSEMTTVGCLGVGTAKKLTPGKGKTKYPPTPAKGFKAKKNGSTKTHR